ncbi:hypothetical protein [Microcoleus sp. N9_A1]|uniref:hypothetical protein n=1 Tax=Microcoleus sp. N9_A1 TaxID=3055380 RepID=UPI002FD4E809
MKILPEDELKINCIEALSELEDDECHRKRKFPNKQNDGLGWLVQAIAAWCST